MNIYTENKNDIIHETSVDFVLRPCTKEIHIVQYDKSLPIIKVELFKNGERYVLSENAVVNVRVGKLDHTFVYESILGTNDERNIVYFEISEQMALIPGKIWPVIEVIETNRVACSSPLCFIIEKNPIQEGQIESHDSFPIIYEIQGTVANNEVRISNLEHQVSEELVTLHTNQKITGEKTFGDGLNIQNDVNHASYNISTFRIDQEYNIDELQIRKKGDTYSLLSVVAPTQDSKEATLALKVENSGTNSNETYFMDISVMNYMNPDEDPEESIYIQSRNASVKPNFNIGYTDETQTRHKKFIITHDSLPIMLNSTGIWIKNTNDKSIHSWADRTELSLEELQKIKNITQIENNITQINNDFASEITRVDNNITQINNDLTSEITRVDNNIENLENRKVDVGQDGDRLRIYSFGKFDGSIYHNITVATSYTDLNLEVSYEFIPNIKFLNEAVVRLEPNGINQNYDSGVYQIYGHMPLSAAENKRSSLEYCFNISNTPNPAYIPQYNVDGRLKSNDPVDNDDVVNKRTLDSSFRSFRPATRGYTFNLTLQEGGTIRPNVHLSIVAYRSDGTYSTHDLYSSSDLGAINIELYNVVVAVKIQCVSMGSGNYVFNTTGSGNVFGTIINPGITKIWDFASISGLGNGDQADLLLLGDCSCTIIYKSN